MTGNQPQKRPPAPGPLARVDIAWLAAFRAVFGVLILAGVLVLFAEGRVRSVWVRPDFHFSHPGLAWIQPWPGAGMHVHFAVLGLLAACVALGLFHRLASALLLAGLLFAFLSDASAYSDAAWLACLFAATLALAPAHRAWSLDVRLGRVEPCAWVPGSWLWMVRLQAALVYFFGGIAKLNADWIGGLPLKYWLADCAGIPVLGTFLNQPWAVTCFAWGTALFGLLVAPLLVWRRSRPAAFLFACCFHATNALVLGAPVPWLLVAATLCFFDPGWPRRFHLLPAAPDPGARTAGPAPVPLLALFALLQLFLPLRHLLIPGSAAWTGEGRDFSWSAGSRSHSAAALFYVGDPEKDLVRAVDPAETLDPARLRFMASRPEMLRQFARDLAGREQARTGSRPRVTVRALASLNARLPRLLVDPAADLAARPPTLGHDAWVLPATREAVAGGSASEFDSLARRCDLLRKHIAALTNVLAETAGRIAGVDAALEKKFAMKPDALYFLDAAARTVFELRRRPGAPEEVANLGDIDRSYERIPHLKLVSFNQSSELAALLGNKQKLRERERVLEGLRWQKEKARAQALEELQDARMAARDIEPAPTAD